MEEKGHGLFESQIFADFASRAAGYVISAMERERDGVPQDRQLLNDAVKVLPLRASPPLLLRSLRFALPRRGAA
jgi:hypothetical protein